jgi:hypothetical protein
MASYPTSPRTSEHARSFSLSAIVLTPRTVGQGNYAVCGAYRCTTTSNTSRPHDEWEIVKPSLRREDVDTSLVN